MSITGQAGEVPCPDALLVGDPQTLAPTETEVEPQIPKLADDVAIGRAVGNAILDAVAQSSAATAMSRRVVRQVGGGFIEVDGKVLPKPRPVNTSPEPATVTSISWGYGSIQNVVVNDKLL